MSCAIKLAFLVTFASLRDVSVLSQSTTDQDNAVIEVFNNCKCVYYYQCDKENNVITNGESIIEVRFKDTPPIECRGGSFQNEIICCKLNGTETQTIRPIIKTPDIEQKNSTSHKKKIQCGVQKTIIHVRIFAGEDELTPLEGEFPWMAAIFLKMESGNYKFHCTGSLIHNKVVLTANHCVHRKKHSSFKVIVNGMITLPIPGNRPEDERNVTEIVHHPEYNAGTLFNDAALLILDAPFVAGKQNYINKLCLPPKNATLDNTRCLVAGWGKDANGQSLTEMKKVELPFVNHTLCQDLLRNTRLSPRFQLHESFMCAGGEKGRDACKGDGGSPLMCPQESDVNRYFQVGIVSWGIGCGEENVPGVYGNVGHFSDWIRNELRERQLRV